MIIKSTFRPLAWLSSPHLQTLWPVLVNRGHGSFGSSHRGRQERLILSDGETLDLAWFDNEGPLVIILHGLEGSIDSPYAVAVTQMLAENGFHTLFMHFRGCGTTTGSRDKTYHSGETADFSEVIEHAAKVTGKPVYAAIGYSLGGNVLLKWLGEKAEKSPIERAISVSVPYVLSDAALRMNTGLSHIYQTYLLTKLRQSYKEKYKERPSPLSINVADLKDFFSFDDQVTAPLNGFSGAEEYYRLSSSHQYLKHIHTKTLMIHAKDDPFMFEKTIPIAEDLSRAITLEIADHGGHVGFIGGTIKPERWLEPRILEFLNSAE